ncbi:MAG: Insertion element protein, partial [Cyanobacteriota bacterium]|nr:Insertion element protein [Cyanobacteriota bacterium]
IDERIARFSTVAELFQERRTVVFPSTASHPAALSQSAQKEVTPLSEAFLATVAVNQNVAEQNFPEIIPALNSNAIESLDVLKNILVEIIESAKLDLKEDLITLAKIKTIFLDKYQSHPDSVVKSFFGEKSSLIKYLQSESGVFEVKLIDQKHQVGLVAKKSSTSKTHSSAALEASLVKIITGLTAQSPGSYIPVSQVASEFNKLYNQPITKKLQSLNLGNKVIKFLQSCKTFKIKKNGKIYEVAIAQSGP